MKTITFIVPCYNSQEYMEKCLNTLLPAGKDAEIIIIDDGSSDNTAAIADKYALEHSEMIKVIHQPNKGHGGAINTGLKHAAGTFFKVIDSDDWVNEESLNLIMKKLREFIQNDTDIDMIISNYVYERLYNNTQNKIHYKGIFPQDCVFEWKDMIRIDITRYLMMHSVIYKTQILRDYNLVLPEHTFYVDSILLYCPLPHVKKMYYINTDFYRYYTGRPDQSVSEKMLAKRVDQQLKVLDIMVESHDMAKIRASEKKLANFMRYFLSAVYTIAVTAIAMSNSKENDKKRKEMWKKLKKRDKRLYIRIRYFSKAFFMAFPGFLGKKLSVIIYRIVKIFYKFN